MPDKCTGRLLLTCSLSSVSELCFLLSLWLHQVNMHQSLYETLLAPFRILTLKYLDWSGSSSALNYDTSKEKSGPWLNVIDIWDVLWGFELWKFGRPVGKILLETTCCYLPQSSGPEATLNKLFCIPNEVLFLVHTALQPPFHSLYKVAHILVYFMKCISSITKVHFVNSVLSATASVAQNASQVSEKHVSNPWWWMKMLINMLICCCSCILSSPNAFSSNCGTTQSLAYLIVTYLFHLMPKYVGCSCKCSHIFLQDSFEL